MMGYEKSTGLRQIMDFLSDMVFLIDGGGRLAQVNEAVRRIMGHSLEGLLMEPAEKVIHLDQGRLGDFLAQAACSVPLSSKGYVRAGNLRVRVNWSAFRSEEEGGIICLAHPVQPPASAKAFRTLEINRLLIEQGTDMHALLDEKGHYLSLEGAYRSMWGYEPEQLRGRNALSLIHEEDTGRIAELLARVHDFTQPITLEDFRLKAASGEWRWVRSTVSNQLQNPAIGALFITSRDITEQKAAELKLRESEQRFRSLFENNPDMVIYQDKAGIILEANPSFLSFFRKQKDQVLKQPISSLLPPDIALHFQERHREAFSGQKVKYEVEFDSAEIGKKVLCVVKVPLADGDRVVGVHTVIQDLTAETMARRSSEQQARELGTIFESITDAFCTLDAGWRLTYVNSAFERVLQLEKAEVLGRTVWSLFPEEKGGIFYRQCREAVQTGSAVYFDIFLQRYSLWLEVRAFPSEQGLSVYFTDITGRVMAKQELEKLSLVASHTTNGVVITDNRGLVEWVNEGFTRITGYGPAEVIGREPRALLRGPRTDRDEVRRVEELLREGKPFSSVLLNYRKSGEPFWVSMDISPVFDEAGKLRQYIAIHRDISLRVEAEAQLLKMAQDLYHKNSDLEQFTYIISHNLRGPVANALGFAELLLELGKESEMYDTSLTYLKDSITRLDEVLRDVSQVLLIRNKRGVLELGSVAVADVWQQVAIDLQEQLLLCQGRTEVKIEQGLLVQAHRAYLYSIFHNLLTNSVKYRAEERPLLIRVEAFSTPEGEVAIRFSDNGSGIDMNKAGDQLFKLYRRFHLHREGRGIGLFLVKTHVEAMEGRIAVSSQVGVGTTFTIHLKAGRSEHPQ